MLYVDLDGVIADFDSGYEALFGMRPSVNLDNVDWARVRKISSFYAHLPIMRDAYILWDSIKHKHPTVLSGIPANANPEQSDHDKREWVAHYLGENVPVLTCRARDKSTYCRPGDVIIDDNPKYKDLWLSKGGVWITHVNALDTLDQLKRMNIL